jgi:hypothetical protein
MIPALGSITKRLCPEPKKRNPQTEWRPVFKVVKTGRQRVDRTYGMSMSLNDTYQQGVMLCHTYDWILITFAVSFQYAHQFIKYADGWVENLFSSQLEMYVRAPIHE